MKSEYVHRGIIGIFVALYALVATISMINSVAFFDLAHNSAMSWVLAVGFELGAAASLAAIIILDKTNKGLVWGLFILLTSFQMMANSYHAYVNLDEYSGWIELFGLTREDPIFQKRVLAGISGGVLPLISLGFIKSLVDYLKPNNLPTDVPKVSNEEWDEEDALDQVLNSMVEDISEEEAEETILESITTKQDVVKPPVQKQTMAKPSQQPSQTEKKKISPTQGYGQVTVEKNVKAKPANRGGNSPNYKP